MSRWVETGSCSWWRTWMTGDPNCWTLSDDVAVATGPFGDGVTVGGTRYLCTKAGLRRVMTWPKSIAAEYACASSAEGQGLVNALARPVLTYLAPPEDTIRMLIPGGVSPSGTTRTPSTPADAAANAADIARRAALRKAVPWIIGAGIAVVGLTGVFVARRGRRTRRRR